MNQLIIARDFIRLLDEIESHNIDIKAFQVIHQATVVHLHETLMPHRPEFEKRLENELTTAENKIKEFEQKSKTLSFKLSGIMEDIEHLKILSHHTKEPSK